MSRWRAEQSAPEPGPDPCKIDDLRTPVVSVVGDGQLLEMLVGRAPL